MLDRRPDDIEQERRGWWDGLSRVALGPSIDEHHGASRLTAWERVNRVRRALTESGLIARDLAGRRITGIDLSAIWPILLQACKDIALYYGGSVVLGAALGGALGFFAGGVGVVPGAAVGAGLGAEAGAWVLALLGLKSLIEYLGDALPRALGCYERGFRQAWGTTADADGSSVIRGGQVTLAAVDFAEGHVIFILALLTALVAYLTRGRGDKAAMLEEIRASPRLGPKVAEWVEANEGKLAAHPQMQGRPAAAIVAQAERDSDQAMTPSQLRRAKEEGAPPQPLKPPMARKKVPCFRPNDLPQAMLPEFDRQLAGQEAGLNGMTVDEYLRGREAFKDAVRDSKVARDARADYKARLAKEAADQLMERGVLPGEAKAQAAEMAAEKMKTLAALHNPDMVAAGRDVIADFGDKNVNSRIGAQWKGRVAELDSAAHGVPEAVRARTKMNAKLERCK